MDKTTKGFVIAACSVVIVAGGAAVFQAGASWWSATQREQANQKKQAWCNRVALDPDRGKWNWSGSVELDKCRRQFPGRY